VKAIVIVIVWLVAFAETAEAYPQFQLSRDQMCTSCHLSPAGGGLLSENGLTTAEVMSQWGTNPEFLNGAWTPPSWLTLGGDVRAMGGYHQSPQRFLEAFPMQGDLYGRATFENFAVHATVGFRPAQWKNEALTRVYAREHYVQWQSEPGSAEGLWIRVGRLMPVFGLRFVEHPVYTRRYGGTPLFSETYGASASWVTPKWEGHVTGFIVDPLIDPVRLEHGAAAYGELRLGEHTQVGGGGMLEVNDWNKKYRGTVTAKHYLATPGIALQAEVQIVNPHVGDFGVTQLVGYLMGSYFVTDAVLVDLGIGRYDENLRITNLDRNTIDLNVHWFVTSHFEALLVSHYEQLGIAGDAGPFGAWVMAQAHYRL
jgi:hypothetical protein